MTNKWRTDPELPQKLKSLWPRTYDQKCNMTRLKLIYEQTEALIELAGGDEVNDYNIIIDAISAENETAYIAQIDRLVTMAHSPK